MLGKNIIMNEIHESKYKNIIYIILMVSVVLNIIMVRNLLMPQIFGLVYLTVIYILFHVDMKKYIYYVTLLFSILDFGLKMPITSRIGIYYFYMTLALYYLILFIDLKKKKISISLKDLFKNKYYIFIIIFTLYIIFSIFIANDKKLALKTIFVYLIMISYMVMNVIENKNRKELKSTLKFLEYMLIGILILGIVKILGFGPNIRTVYTDMGYDETMLPFLKRLPIIFFYNPNNYATFLVICSICIFVKLFYTSLKKDKLYYSIILVACLINIIFTSCRTAWITIFLIYIITFLISFIVHKKKLRKFSICWIIISLIIFMGMSFVPGMQDYYGKFYNLPIINKIFFFQKVPNVKLNDALNINSNGSHSIAERNNLIHDVIQGVIYEKHFLGFGAGNTVNYIKNKNNTLNIYNIHSLWFELMGDFGIFIFIYYIYIYANMLIVLYKNFFNAKDIQVEKYSLMFGLNLFSFIFLAFAPSTVLSYAPYWILIGLGAAVVINIIQKGEIHENTNID